MNVINWNWDPQLTRTCSDFLFVSHLLKYSSISRALIVCIPLSYIPCILSVLLYHLHFLAIFTYHHTCMSVARLLEC